MGHTAATGLVDCDIHPAVPGMKALLPPFRRALAGGDGIPWRGRARFRLLPAQRTDHIGADNIFLFSTDYPPQGLRPALLGKALRQMPLATYPRLKETA